MRQSRAMSLLEAVVNTAIGYVEAARAQLAILPVFGLRASLVQRLRIGGAMTLVSVTRGHAPRRALETPRARQTDPTS